MNSGINMTNKTKTNIHHSKKGFTSLGYLYLYTYNLYILENLTIFINRHSVGTYHRVFWEKYD